MAVRHKTSLLALAGAACLLLGATTEAKAGTIDTTTSWNGTDGIIYFGEPDTATYGQTFTVGADTFLQDFSFWLNDESGTVNFAAYLMKWDGAKALGNILYQSSPYSTGQKSGMEKFTFDTGGINLAAGEQYVAFLNVSNFLDGTYDAAAMGGVPTDVYDGGKFVFLNNGGNFSAVTQQDWSEWYIPDAAFKATFTSSGTPVPTPALLPGLIGMGIAALRKRKGEAAEEASEA